jgi:hypothetical protein
MRRILLAALGSLAAAPAAHAEQHWVVEAHYADRAALQRAAQLFEHVIVDRQRHTLRVDTNEQGIAALEDAGIAVGIDGPASAKLQAFYTKADAAAARGLGIDGIPGYECFRTVDETYATMDQLQADFPHIAHIDEIGPTWKKVQNPDDGFTMRAMRITNFDTLGGDRSRPKFAAYFSIHAREYTPAEIGTRFAEWLVDNYGSDPEATWLVDHNDFHLILLANPDARIDAQNQIYQRKNLDRVDGPCGDQDAFQQPGIDLNRNFPFHWDITRGDGSSSNTCSQTFHGPFADGSNPNDHLQGTPEPETQNLFSYVAGNCDSDGDCQGGLFADHRDGPTNPPSVEDDGGAAAPDDTSGFFLDMHSNAALVLWPWGDTFDDSPNVSALTTLGRRIAWFTGYTPEQSNELYFTDGTTVDSMYGLLGVASYTIETDGFDFFEDCSDFEAETAPTNLATLRYISRTLHAPYQLPAGPDTVSVTADAAVVDEGDPVGITAALDSGRFNFSNGSQPVRNIASAQAYVDALPWAATSPGITLAAGDGAYDSSHETAVGEIPTSHLTPGRHFVYVQATDTDGHAGTPNAVFFDVNGPTDRIFADGFEGAR